ncbi:MULTISPECIES: type I-E CRISPR-associated endoribonuclease Cas2e [Gulbenkiania]|uniref:CRISPR-associated endoribonuclease Cas2, subtype I-E/ECOLI n=1 Tax=Gulbenkiania indica TaxID=375574 RepID=A0A0K6GVY1_9NEIS|nr:MULTISPECIES: type I-E CRISPR-associated endoribonuclease Cas2e [Gulbenkiania]CUA82902.1 CRISPR-associated endoribonuclease Cas2, subtype I-E/ECOLI [Gulbenkiania indica]
MVVVLANELPPAVRGRLKLWFVEPRANVFVSGIKDSVARTVVEYLLQHCPANAGVMIFMTQPQAPGYRWYIIGTPRKPQLEISGLQLIVETLIS